ncbi:tyrocidine synthetase III [Candidatus Magnetoovum chiemensis]|nr:tyrocidine synthetase III [Candidatus Magnetoovum chiemensis]
MNSLYDSLNEVVAKQEYYELSYNQKRLWILHEVDINSCLYNQHLYLKLDGRLNVEALKTAFRSIVSRQESLRTVFLTEDGIPMQGILKDKDIVIKIQTIDLSKENDVWLLALNYARKDMSIPFDLSRFPLFRVTLLKLSENNHILLIALHSIICDRLSLNVLLRQLAECYKCSLSDSPRDIAPLSIQYKNYVNWHKKFLQTDSAKKEADFWLNTINTEADVLHLPFNQTYREIYNCNAQSVSFKFPKEMAQELIKLGSAHSTDLFIVLITVIKILIYRYTAEGDIIIASSVSGRFNRELEGLIGNFENILPIRVVILDNDSFLILLKKVEEAVKSLNVNQDYPFIKLIDDIELKKKTFNYRYFKFFIGYDKESSNNAEFNDINVSLFDTGYTLSEYELSFILSQNKDDFILTIKFNTERFSKMIIERLWSHLLHIAKGAINDEQILINNMELLSEEEKQKVLIKFNSAAKEYTNNNKIITDIFESIAHANGSLLSVIYEDKTLTYKELNERSNQLAHYLRKNYNTRHDAIIGLMTQRSEWLIIGLLGILKAGCVYLPLDPSYPEKRLEYMLLDTRCKLVLIDSVNYEKASNFTFIDLVEIEKTEQIKKYSKNNPEARATSENPAYVIYTSGSTGKPKGVVVENRSFINMSLEQIKTFGINKYDRVLMSSSASFDGCLSEIFMALFSGACLVVIGSARIDNINLFIEYIEQKKVTVLALPPTYLSMLRESASNRSFDSVKTIITAGEAAKLKDARFFAKRLKYFNAYGPAEASVCISIHKVDPKRVYKNSVPIGAPIANNSIYILDDQLRLLPEGLPGEICISGLGLARGYINNPSLTQQSFIANPFEKGTKLYKTGDIGRWRNNGELEFIGRKDEQTKIMGYRLEPAEIENILLKHKSVKSAAIIIKDENGKRTPTAYVVCSDNLCSDSALRKHLSKYLPEFMLPESFVFLKEMPLTASSKIDKRALSCLTVKTVPSVLSSHQYGGPKNEIEQKLIEIWSSVLNKKGISVNDNFFDLGGDNVKAIHIVKKIRKEFDLKLYVFIILQFPTIRELSESLYSLKVYYKKFDNEMAAFLNVKGDMKIFCCPPITGFGFSYKNLTNYLGDYSFYCFNFIQTNNLIEKYAELICSIQRDGPYVLFGYSTGGNLVFELARTLLELGFDVSDIILMDAWKRENFIEFENLDLTYPFDENFPAHYLYDEMAEIFDNPYIKQMAIEKLKEYMEYIRLNTDKGVINSNIHLIKSEQNDNFFSGASQNWASSTNKNFKVYYGFSDHFDMLKGINLKYNTWILSEILTGIFSKKG